MTDRTTTGTQNYGYSKSEDSDTEVRSKGGNASRDNNQTADHRESESNEREED